METEEKYKVVIVDDERTAIDALRRELEPYREFEVKGIAGNGAKGKKMIMELHPDLLFLDVELPDTLGLNLLSEIREDILWDMKVVFYTSYDKYLLQALRESAFDFLLKPFEAEDLKVIMDRYRKAMSSTSLPLLPSFASSIKLAIQIVLPLLNLFKSSSTLTVWFVFDIFCLLLLSVFILLYFRIF
jgi:two-component system LytT family response regulator